MATSQFCGEQVESHQPASSHCGACHNTSWTIHNNQFGCKNIELMTASQLSLLCPASPLRAWPSCRRMEVAFCSRRGRAAVIAPPGRLLPAPPVLCTQGGCCGRESILL